MNISRKFVLALVAIAIAASGFVAYRHHHQLLGWLGLQAEPVRPPFSGASRQREFLSSADVAEAVKRGLLPEGTRSIISTGGTLHYGQWKWDDAGVPEGPITIRVSLRRQLVSVFRGPDEIGTAVVVYGNAGKASPVGRMPILSKIKDYHSRTYDAPMPYSLFIRNDGVAVHGSPIAADHATNGCIGIPVGFAAKLFDVAKVGDIVEIRDGN